MSDGLRCAFRCDASAKDIDFVLTVKANVTTFALVQKPSASMARTINADFAPCRIRSRKAVWIEESELRLSRVRHSELFSLLKRLVRKRHRTGLRKPRFCRRFVRNVAVKFECAPGCHVVQGGS